MPEAEDAPIVLARPDPRWPAMFESERAALAAVLAPWLAGPIEHIGSTAIAGLPAKPIIDIMAAVESLEASRGAIQAVRAMEYQYAPYHAEVMHWFCKPGPAMRTHHLHLVPFGSPLWKERLAFRNSLRSDPKLAADYAALKARLAHQHRGDREAYTDAKTPFIAAALARVRP